MNPTNPDISECKILISSLPASVTESQLRSILAPFGKVTYFFHHPASTSPGFVLATFETRAQAESAVLNIHDTRPFGDIPLFCKLANEKLFSVPAGPKSAPADVSEAELPPLPSPWQEFRSPEGFPYYHNPETSETTWSHPGALALPAPAPAFALGPRGATFAVPKAALAEGDLAVSGLVGCKEVGGFVVFSFADVALSEGVACNFRDRGVDVLRRSGE